MYQDGARRCSHAELHPSLPLLREAESPQYVPKISPINGVISIHEVHLLEEVPGTRAMPCRHNLLGHHDVVYHLSSWDEGGLKWADQTVHHFTEAISQDLGYYEVYRVGQRNGTEITDLFCPRDLWNQDKVYLVKPFYLTTACMEVPHQLHHFEPQHIPALFVKEEWYPIRARGPLRRSGSKQHLGPLQVRRDGTSIFSA